MQISNVTAGYPDPAMLGKRSEPTEGSGPGAAKLAERLGSGGGGSKAAAAILAKYDVTHITPAEYSEMIQKLQQAGVLSEGEFQELSTIRLDLEAAGIGPEERIDLREFYADKIKQTQQKLGDADRRTASQQLAPLAHRLDWIEKFAVIQANPEAVGLDARV